MGEVDLDPSIRPEPAERLARGGSVTRRRTVSRAPPLQPEDLRDPDDEIVTLEEFLERWTAGTYVFTGMGDEGEKSTGETELTYALPAAPADVDFDGSVISWAPGDDLGNCASAAELDILVADGVLPVHPRGRDRGRVGGRSRARRGRWKSDRRPQVHHPGGPATSCLRP